MNFSAHNKIRFYRKFLMRMDFSAPNKVEFGIEILISMDVYLLKSVDTVKNPY